MSDTLMDFDEAVRRYDPVLGLEVHVELGTATKMFDWAPNAFGDVPNTNTSPVSLGLPGVLDRRLLEGRLPAGLFYNLMVAARKAG